MLLGHPVLLEGEKSRIHKQPRHMGEQGVFAQLINLKQPPDTRVYRASLLCTTYKSRTAPRHDMLVYRVSHLYTSALPEVLLNHLLDTQRVMSANPNTRH